MRAALRIKRMVAPLTRYREHRGAGLEPATCRPPTSLRASSFDRAALESDRAARTAGGSIPGSSVAWPRPTACDRRRRAPRAFPALKSVRAHRASCVRDCACSVQCYGSNVSGCAYVGRWWGCSSCSGMAVAGTRAARAFAPRGSSRRRCRQPLLTLRPQPELRRLAEEVAAVLELRTGQRVEVGSPPPPGLLEAVPTGHVALARQRKCGAARARRARRSLVRRDGSADRRSRGRQRGRCARGRARGRSAARRRRRHCAHRRADRRADRADSAVETDADRMPRRR